MKQKKILMYVLSAILFVSIGVYAGKTFYAEDVLFVPNENDWEVENVKDAINDLYKYYHGSVDFALKNIDFLLTEENIDTAINNPDKYSSSILNDKNKFLLFLNNDYAFNKMVNNVAWTSQILKDNNLIKLLDESNPISVPSMTSYTAPSGEAFASSSYPGYEAYKAFNGNYESYWGVNAGQSYKNQYLGYAFDKPVWVYKIEIGMTNGKQNTDYIIEASNDRDGNYVQIKTGHQDGKLTTLIPDAYAGKYKYYRVRMLSSIAQSGNDNTVIIVLNFYGK